MFTMRALQMGDISHYSTPYMVPTTLNVAKIPPSVHAQVMSYVDANCV